jgi:hypothetical protein
MAANPGTKPQHINPWGTFKFYTEDEMNSFSYKQNWKVFINNNCILKSNNYDIIMT